MSRENYDTSERFKVRLEARLKNGSLVSARESLGFTGKKMAEEIGLSPPTYYNYEAMKLYPGKKTQIRICEYLAGKGIFFTEEELFPEELRNIAPTKYVVEREIPRAQLISLDRVNQELLPYVEGEIAITYNERYEIIEEGLATLTEREAEVLRMRFGLEGEGPKTLDEIVPIFDVTRERVRQIEIKALEKLRRPHSKSRRILERAL